MSAGKQPQMYLTPGIICHCSEVTNVYFLFGRQTKFDFFCTLTIPCLTILVKFSFNDHIMTADISLVLISAFCGVYFLDYVHPKVLLILIISDPSLPSAVYLLPRCKKYCLHKWLWHQNFALCSPTWHGEQGNKQGNNNMLENKDNMEARLKTGPKESES